MDGEVFVGHHCPVCGSTIGIAAGVGGPLKCPGCGGPMQAASDGPPTRVLANVTCKGCGSRFGMISIVGSSEAKCPSCGESLI